MTRHILRHSCAVIMLQATRDIRKVALWLGHADIRTTEVYLKMDPSEKLDVIGGTPPAGSPAGTVQDPRRTDRVADGAPAGGADVIRSPR